MDYEKKYNDALDWMRKVYPTLNGSAKEDAEHYFPELKESEDERIRKRLIDCLKFSLKGAEEQDAAGCSRQKDIEAYKWGIAYLEKQRERKPGDEDRYMEGYMNGMNDTLKEQKPVNPEPQ